MPVPGPVGPDRVFCLLLLLLVAHGPEGGRPPQRRFEYKLSFKGPKLVLPGAGIPFWSHHGDAIPGLEEVRLAPSMRNRSGALWSKAVVPFSAWEVEMHIRVTGPGRRGAQGLALWYTRDRGHVGSILEGPASWDGIKVLFDSSVGDTQNSPAVRVLASKGHSPDEPTGDGASPVLGSCYQDFRNRPHPFRARITYWGQRLRVSVSRGLTPNDPEEVCVNVGPLLLAPGGFFGISASTSTLADDHDVLAFLTFSLREPGPEVMPPFLGEEQRCLARQLEELRGRLALGAKGDIISKSDPEAQDEGEKHFDPEEMLGRHSRILHALQGLSEQLAQAERQWREQAGSLDGATPGGEWEKQALPSLCTQLVSHSLGGQGDCGERPLVAGQVDLTGSGSRIGEQRLALLQDSAQVRALLRGQQTLLRDLQEMRVAAARMASGTRAFYLPVGTKHHFSELSQILSLLQKDLWDLAKAPTKASRPPRRPLGASSCLRSSFFLFFLLVQTVGFFAYVHFRQELDKILQACLSTGSLPLGPAPHIPRALGVLRRQSRSRSTHA
ncbi:protein ERGIC-53-like [Echinops telfairi]|uniref:Protein ERGIC-53-like n=1 Tax=Echinops telfairi TaxID=9371 RepID=A0ABM0J0G3_ECHTE|nr:protein ERGIC-53-like [Echinops telfairi]